MSAEQFFEFDSPELPIDRPRTPMTFRYYDTSKGLVEETRDMPYTKEEARRLMDAHEHHRFIREHSDSLRTIEMPWYHSLDNRAQAIQDIRQTLEQLRPMYHIFMSARAGRQLDAVEQAVNFMYLDLLPFSVEEAQGRRSQPEQTS